MTQHRCDDDRSVVIVSRELDLNSGRTMLENRPACSCLVNTFAVISFASAMSRLRRRIPALKIASRKESITVSVRQYFGLAARRSGIIENRVSENTLFPTL
jgi:hypothetical protein